MKKDIDAEEYLSGIPMWAKEKNSLADIRSFLKEMGNPDEKMKIFHVAGTNGKGSVCAFLQSALRAAGFRVGTFTSPHLIETRERIQINNNMVSEKAFLESCLRIRSVSEKKQKHGLRPPTYFEFLFYMAMDLFDLEKPDFVILETGMGGRLDTTNVIRSPLVSVITSISLDHTQYLGNTVEEIAWEKAGIIKPEIPVIFDAGNETAARIIRKRARELHALAVPGDRTGYGLTGFRENGIEARLYGRLWQDLDVTIPSQAQYQVENALLSLLALETVKLAGLPDFNMSAIEVKKGFQSMSWPARMEETLPGVFLDGAHNPGGMEAFLKAAGKLCREREKRAMLLFSAVSDKEHGSMIEKLGKGLPLDYAAVAHMASERGAGTEVLMEEFQRVCRCGVKGFEAVEEAVLFMLDKTDEDHLLFCVGSLYLMGEIKMVLRRNGYDRF